VQKAWEGVSFTLKKKENFILFVLFYANLSAFGGTVCGCIFVILRLGVPGGGVSFIYASKKKWGEIFFNVNLSDHNKGKRHAIPIYSLIDYEFPI
jgi:hypothetical protein